MLAYLSRIFCFSVDVMSNSLVIILDPVCTLWCVFVDYAVNICRSPG